MEMIKHLITVDEIWQKFGTVRFFLASFLHCRSLPAHLQLDHVENGTRARLATGLLEDLLEDLLEVLLVLLPQSWQLTTCYKQLWLVVTVGWLDGVKVEQRITCFQTSALILQNCALFSRDDYDLVCQNGYTSQSELTARHQN